MRENRAPRQSRRRYRASSGRFVCRGKLSWRRDGGGMEGGWDGWKNGEWKREPGRRRRPVGHVLKFPKDGVTLSTHQLEGASDSRDEHPRACKEASGWVMGVSRLRPPPWTSKSAPSRRSHPRDQRRKARTTASLLPSVLTTRLIVYGISRLFQLKRMRSNDANGRKHVERPITTSQRMV
jgi:hypothetical protein